MEIRISNLKTEFNNISLIRSKIINVFESLKNKSDKLKTIYSDFIKNSNSYLFVFGLDSFHFQSKLIDLEYDDMKRIFLFVNNRMYCEYFKLYKIICSYVIENVTDKKIIEIIKGNNFPVYKDLEPFKDYKFETTLEIHENILVLLNSIASIINNRENELSIHRSKQLIGLNIDNFVNSFNYEITLMREKVNLFLSYIEFFHKLHAKYLKRFSNKIQLMSNHINSDIQFDENAENNTNAKMNDSNDIIDEDQNQNNKNDLSLNLVIDTSDNKYSILDDYESGFNTPSNSSCKSTESQNKGNKKIKLPKFIKNGFKTMNNIINGCNVKSRSDTIVSDNNDLVLEKLYLNLNDFNGNPSEIEETIQECNVVVEEVVVLEEPEPQPDSVEAIVEEVVVLEEPEPQPESVEAVAEEVVVLEEPEPQPDSVEAIVEEVVVLEEPEPQPESVEAIVEEVVVLEEPEPEPVEAVAEEPLCGVVGDYNFEEINSNEKETQTELVDNENTISDPFVVAEEEPVVANEEEPVVISEEDPVVTEEEPVVVTEEEPVVVTEEEPVVVTEEEPVVVAEEELVVAAEEEPVVIAEEIAPEEYIPSE
jgi:hypothetical protein